MYIGDRVKFIKSPYKGKGIRTGCTGVIVQQMSSMLLEVQPDEFHDDGDLWPFEADELEVIQ